MFSPKDPRKTDYISLNIQESATFARGTSRSLWRVNFRDIVSSHCGYFFIHVILFKRTCSILCTTERTPFAFQQWNQLSRFQRNILYFAVITIVLVIFYLLPGDNKNGVLDESDYNNIEVAQETLKYEKVRPARDERVSLAQQVFLYTTL